jgi:hypothetical protein
MDILSNGFKLRTTDAYVNGNGNTMIFMAFAESPFKVSLARMSKRQSALDHIDKHTMNTMVFLWYRGRSL